MPRSQFAIATPRGVHVFAPFVDHLSGGQIDPVLLQRVQPKELQICIVILDDLQRQQIAHIDVELVFKPLVGSAKSATDEFPLPQVTNRGKV